MYLTIIQPLHLLPPPLHPSISLVRRDQKFYKTMTEVKPKVESVIKSGRQIVDKRQVDNPEKLSKELDALKLLYNNLGSKVAPFIYIY